MWSNWAPLNALILKKKLAEQLYDQELSFQDK